MADWNDGNAVYNARNPMRYKEVPPGPPLAQHVECYWSFEKERARIGQPEEPIAPDGCMELIFNLSDPFQRFHPDGTIECQPMTILTGQTRGYVIVQPTGNTNLFGVRFHPAGAFAFLGFPVSELTDQIVDLNLVWGCIAKELAAQILMATSFPDRVRIVEAFLRRKLIPPTTKDLAIMELADRIVRTSGGIRLQDLAEDIDISSRHLERRFQEIVGIRPKLLSRILRFQKTFRLYQNGFENWPALAADCGYFDQAHFIRDFKEFTGKNPSSYFQNEPEMASQFTRKNRMSDLYNNRL